ncbi:MAG: bacillithiol biosynthesis cysteine-adding enzyme BshC [Bacteroidota bacterium]
MKADCASLTYEDTGYFSPLVIDYLKQAEDLKAFYAHPPDLYGINAAIMARQQFNQPRALLVKALQKQYEGTALSTRVSDNIEALLQTATFTVTTAHQPNILTGPLYFIYKILHAIKLSADLKDKFPAYHFVPVYYMGSEDADLEELGHIFLNGEKVEWKTDQSGAVGRMDIKGIDKLIDRLEGEFGNLPCGAEMVALCRHAYTPGKNVQQATLELVNALFKDYGLVVVIPDNSLLKSAFNEVVIKEITSQFSYPLVQETISSFGEKYKAQAAGRAINLFYLSDDGSRDRIELKEDQAGKSTGKDEVRHKEFVVVNKNLVFSLQSILEELRNHPERFSANVILRGVFQETILPNIAFIGGGGELAYWMELKKVFEAVKVPYPVLLLRNSFLLIPSAAADLQKKLSIETKSLFEPLHLLNNQVATKLATHKLDTKQEQVLISEIYNALQEQASGIDTTLKAHVAALHVRSLQGLIGLEKKFLRAEKKSQAATLSKVSKLHKMLFPNENLQERVENFLPLFARYGNSIIELLYSYSEPFPNNFTILYLEEE